VSMFFQLTFILSQAVIITLCRSTELALLVIEMIMAIRFPTGMGIPWESHGNWTKIRSIEGMLTGMGNNLRGNGSVGMGMTPIPVIPVGINSH